MVSAGAGTTRIERFLAHLDTIAGGLEPSFLPVASTRAGQKGLTVLSYAGLPEPGMLTAVTYGISRGEHEQWVHGKPELCLSLRSTNDLWARALGYIAEQARGACPFSYGDILNLGEPICGESAMTAFMVFAPPLLPTEAFRSIAVGSRLPINIAGAYPIHPSECKYIRRNGLDAFWDLDWDPFDATRPPAA